MPHEWVLGAGDHRRELRANVGDAIVVRLSEHATSGYLWKLASADESVCQLDHSTSAAPASGGVGAARMREFVFRVQSPGSTVISLEERRPWEGDVEAAASFVVHVVASAR